MFQNDREVKSHWGMMGKGSAPQQPSSPRPPHTHTAHQTLDLDLLTLALWELRGLR